jgi:hypothetical protein
MFTSKNFENWLTFGHFRVFLAGTNIVSMGIDISLPKRLLALGFDNRPFRPVIETWLFGRFRGFLKTSVLIKN